MFFAHHPTACNLGIIVPAHTRDMKLKYGKGLILNSMEGREAKHISIRRYSKNTNHICRWKQFFCTNTCHSLIFWVANCLIFSWLLISNVLCFYCLFLLLAFRLKISACFRHFQLNSYLLIIWLSYDVETTMTLIYVLKLLDILWAIYETFWTIITI
jgi:hypothetical protein